MIKLPTQLIKAEIKNPKNLIIFSKPKIGKTTLLSKLPNCLLLDFEEGSDYVDALKVKIIGILPVGSETEEQMNARHDVNKYYLSEIAKAITDAGNPYQFIAVDTLTSLEDMCAIYAETLYSRLPIGKYWFVGKDSNPSGKATYGNILNLPDGAGYLHLRNAVDNVLSLIKKMAPFVILSGHIKDVQLDKKDRTFSSADLDLTGKIKRMVASDSDSIGYLYRKGKTRVITFNGGDDVACGARPEHLKDKEIVIAEENEAGEIETFWERIYPDMSIN